MAKEPIHVSLVIFPESDPSILYGVFDTLWAAGQLWNALHGQPAGAPLFRPRLVGAQAGPVSLVTSVSRASDGERSDGITGSLRCRPLHRMSDEARRTCGRRSAAVSP